MERPMSRLQNAPKSGHEIRPRLKEFQKKPAPKNRLIAAPLPSVHDAIMTTDELLAAAIALHQAGRLHEAAEIYRQAIIAEPSNFLAWHELGLVFKEMGQCGQAVGSLLIGLLPFSAPSRDGNRHLAAGGPGGDDPRPGDA